MDSHERCMGSNGISRLACFPCYENVHLEERVRLPKESECLSKRSFIYVLVLPFFAVTVLDETCIMHHLNNIFLLIPVDVA